MNWEYEYNRLVNSALKLNEIVKEQQQRINKAIEYMDNTYNIKSLEELFSYYSNVEKILKGEYKNGQRKKHISSKGFKKKIK